jgi:hypothetical protein
VKPVQHQQPQAPGAPEVSLRKDESAQDYDLMPKKGRLKSSCCFLGNSSTSFLHALTLFEFRQYVVNINLPNGLKYPATWRNAELSRQRTRRVQSNEYTWFTTATKT